MRLLSLSHSTTYVQVRKLKNGKQLERRLDTYPYVRRRTGLMESLYDNMERLQPNPSWVLGAQVDETVRLPKKRNLRRSVLSKGRRAIYVPSANAQESIVTKWSLITQFAAMRTFGQFKNRASGGARAATYATREATQWDLRFDTANVNVQDIIDRLKLHKQEIVYALVGGKEFGSHPVYGVGAPTHVDPTEHVHCCLIVPKPIKRWQALKFFREEKYQDEYCVPRKQSFTFLGWRLHHIKDDTKIGDERILYEYGTLPMDEVTEHNIKEIKRMLNKFPGPTDPRYEPFLQLATDEGIKRRKVAKMEAELPVLKRELAEFAERRLMTKEDWDAKLAEIDRMKPVVDSVTFDTKLQTQQ